VGFEPKFHVPEKEETLMKKWFRPVVVALLVLFVAACARDKEPAEMTLKAAEEALNAVRAEATQYVPDQVKGVEDALKAAKEKFEKKEYTETLNAAKDLAAKAKELGTAAAAKKAELTKSWGEMSANLSKMVEAIQSKIDALAKMKKLPKDMDKAKVEGAKAGFAEITKTWAEAENAFKGGTLSEALSKAKAVQDKATEIMTTLGIAKG
jgi:hypothetical protein